MLNAMEARASANIEGEHDPARIQEHSLALGEFLQRPAGGKSLLKMHRWMMRGQPHAQPGRYRSVSVRVGQHRPPSPGLVPHLMDELWEWLSEQPPSVPAAIWAHVQFEAIHPFADGNGRTGRAVLQSALGTPAPLSRFILREQENYYKLFRWSEWPAWLEWFCQGTMETSEEMENLPDPLSSTRTWGIQQTRSNQ